MAAADQGTDKHGGFSEAEATRFVNETAARLDRLPLSWFTYRILILAGLAFICEAFDIGIIGSAIVPLKAAYHLGPGLMALLGITGTFGIVVALIPSGILLDVVGRKKVLIAGVAIQGVFTILAGLSTTPTMVAIMRLFAGFGQGAVFPTPVAYMSEFVPPKIRGAMISVVLGFLYFAYPIAPYVSSLIVNHYPVYVSWRIMFLLGGIPLLFIPPMALWMPESPRWAARRGLYDRATEMLKNVEQEVSRRIKKALPPYVVSDTEFSTTKLPWYAAFRRRYVKRTIFLDIMYSGTFVFWYVLLIYQPTLSVREGSTMAAAMRINAYLFIMCGFGGLIMGFFADRIGRKAIIASYAVLGALGLAWFANGAHSLLILLLSGAFVGGCGLGVFPACKTYIAELYPTEIRGRGVYACEAVSRFVGGVLFMYIVASIMNTVSVELVYYIMAFFFLIMTALSTMIYGRETKGMSVDQAATLYD